MYTLRFTGVSLLGPSTCSATWYMFSLLSQQYMNSYSHVNMYALTYTTHYTDYPRVLSIRDTKEMKRKGTTMSRQAEVAAERGANVLMMSRLENTGRLLLIETGRRGGKGKFTCESVVVCVHVQCTCNVYDEDIHVHVVHVCINCTCISMLYVHVHVYG